MNENTNEDKHIIEVSRVSKTFKVGIQDINVLKDVNFNVDWEDFMIIFGPSGSGKSTILHTLLGLEPPTEGGVKFLGQEMYSETSSEDLRSNFRKQHIGMVYQQPNWVKALTVKENVAFPLLLLGRDRDAAHKRAVELLEEIGLQKWADFRPTELSGGQQQRVALARALINNPQVIIADEPTGNLDYENGQKIMQLFYELNKKQDKTIIMVTHDLEYLPYSKTAVNIFDGTVDGVYKGKEKEKILERVKLKRGRDADETKKGTKKIDFDKKPDQEVSNQDSKKQDDTQKESKNNTLHRDNVLNEKNTDGISNTDAEESNKKDSINRTKMT